MHIRESINRRIKKIQKFFYLYTSGLNHREIEQLLKKDTVGAISYFKAKTKIPEQSLKRSSVGTLFNMGKDIFISFMMQLTPARRFFYGLGVAGFLIGLLKVDALLMLGSFVVLNLLLALELVDKLTTRDELEIAREIQLNLQPLEIPSPHFTGRQKLSAEISLTSFSPTATAWSVLSETYPIKVFRPHYMPPMPRVCFSLFPRQVFPHPRYSTV